MELATITCKSTERGTNSNKDESSVKKALTEQTKTIRTLVIVCAFLVVSIVIISTTFGALINVMVSINIPFLTVCYHKHT